ncbi:hypothetical protein G6F65_020865 [Rhizopus arrhizus]|nr:hypothetical protein G6F65_020865 [Rhizopus arrhizus]
MLRVMQGLHQCLPEQRGAAQHAVQPGRRGHFQQHGQAPPGFAHHDAPCAFEFHFPAGVAAVAQLVFQTAHADGVARTIRNPARHEEAAQPFIGLRQHQVRVCLRHGEKPFVAHQLVGVAAARRAQGHGAGADRAQIRTALFFGQPHPDQCAALGGQRRVGRVELTRIQGGQPLAGKVDGARWLALQ